jgi:hypothetical protein
MPKLIPTALLDYYKSREGGGFKDKEEPKTHQQRIAYDVGGFLWVETLEWPDDLTVPTKLLHPDDIEPTLTPLGDYYQRNFLQHVPPESD